MVINPKDVCGENSLSFYHALQKSYPAAMNYDRTEFRNLRGIFFELDVKAVKNIDTQYFQLLEMDGNYIGTKVMAGPGGNSTTKYPILNVPDKVKLVLMMDTGNNAEETSYTELHLQELNNTYKNYKKRPGQIYVGLHMRYIEKMLVDNPALELSYLSDLNVVIYSWPGDPVLDPSLLGPVFYKIAELAKVTLFIVDPVIWLRSLSSLPAARWELVPRQSVSNISDYLSTGHLLSGFYIRKCIKAKIEVFMASQCDDQNMAPLDHLLQVDRGSMIFVFENQTWANEISWRDYKPQQDFIYVQLAEGPGYKPTIPMDDNKTLSMTVDLPYVVGFAEDPTEPTRRQYVVKEVNDMINVLSQAPFTEKDFGIRMHGKFLSHKEGIDVWQPVLNNTHFRWLFISDGTGFPRMDVYKIDPKTLPRLRWNIQMFDKETFFMMEYKTFTTIYEDNSNNLAPTYHTNPIDPMPTTRPWISTDEDDFFFEPSNNMALRIQIDHLSIIALGLLIGRTCVVNYSQNKCNR